MKNEARDRDARVAELLGWMAVGYRKIDSNLVLMGCRTRIAVLSEVPFYSYRIEDTWQIVEHLQRLWTAATAKSDGINDFEHPFDDGAFFDRLHRSADRRWPWAMLYMTPQAIVDAFLLTFEQEDNDGE